MSQLNKTTISIHKNKSNYDAKQKKFKNSLINLQSIINNNNDDTSSYQRKISKAQTYRLLNCIKVLEYLKDYEIQPCNERICRALKQYGKNKENICKLWEQVLSSVNNKKEAINSILVKDIWLQNNKCNSNEVNDMNSNQQKSMNYSYPTPDKSIFFNEFKNSSMNNFLPSPECKPLFFKSTYNNNCNNNNNNDNNNNYMNVNKSSFSSSSDEFSCKYPANYKPAWTISIEQLRNGSNSNYNSFNYNNIAKQYPSPSSSPALFNNYYSN